MIIRGSQSPYVGNFVHGRPWSNLCHWTYIVDNGLIDRGQAIVLPLLDHFKPW